MTDYPMIAEKVSVVMPCYNAASTLRRSVTGVQSQTHLNWELLLVVDGGDGETEVLARSLASLDTRIRVVVSQKNRGVSRSRNLGIRLSRGTWIAFCDADDLWLPSKLVDELNLANKEGAQVVCSGFLFYFPETGRKLPVQTRTKINYQVMLHTNAIPLSTSMYSVVDLGRHYFQDMPSPYIHEDYAFWLRMIRLSTPKIVYLDQATVEISQIRGSRSANKWLSMRSHGYILRSVAQIGGLLWVWLMVNYLWYGSMKRILGKLVRET